MSFLSELRTKRCSLKPSTTTVTYVDGRKFKENGTEPVVEIEREPFGFVVDTKPDNIPAQVTEHIFLGSQDCCDLEVLRKFEIANVLSVGIEAPCKTENVSYKFIQCLDLPETNLYNVLKECMDFIREAEETKKNILVHCNAGVSRSASVVIGYLILVLGFDYVSAYSLVKNVRNCIRLNDGFVKQLKNWRGQ